MSPPKLYDLNNFCLCNESDQNSLFTNYLFLCSTEERTSHRFGTTCGWINNFWVNCRLSQVMKVEFFYKERNGLTSVWTIFNIIQRKDFIYLSLLSPNWSTVMSKFLMMWKHHIFTTLMLFLQSSEGCSGFIRSVCVILRKSSIASVTNNRYSWELWC